MINNLWALMGRVRAEEFRDWQRAYWRYNTLMAELALRFPLTVDVISGVFAALSPNNSYISNLKDTITVLEWAKLSQISRTDKPVVHTYGSNRAKAIAIASGAWPDNILGGAKVRAFWHNVAYPANSTSVTVDGHIYWAWIGRKGAVKLVGEQRRKEGVGLTPKLYEEIAEAIRLIANHHSIRPHEAQAILWHAWRKQNGVLASDQLTFIPDDRSIVTGILEIEMSGSHR